MNNNSNNKNQNQNKNKNKKQSSFSLDSIITMLSILIILGFAVYLFLEVRKLNNRNHLDSYNNDKDKIMYNVCPNYYDIDKDGETCINTFKIGKCKESNPNFKKFFEENKSKFYNKNLQNEMKCEWSKECDVAWDGIDRLC